MVRPACLAAALLSTIAFSAGAQRRPNVRCDNGDTEVRSLEFNGNRALSDFQLERGIATTASTWWRRTFRVFGRRYCLDSIAAMIEDSARLDQEYQRTGFPDVQVRPELVRLGPRAVNVAYHITEGEPMIVDSLEIVWSDSVPEPARFTSGLPIRQGERFSRDGIEATRDTLTRRLRDRGYPFAEVLRNYTTDVSAHRASLTFNIYPQARSWIGQIVIPEPIPAVGRSQTRIDTARVRDVLGIREGALYREAELEAVKRGLFLTEAFRFVDVAIDTTSQFDDQDSLVTINVTLAESQLQATRGSIGWGNLDCIRAGVNHTNYNFLGSLRRLDLNARVSKVGYAKPLDFFDGDLCTSDLRDDRFSDTLNYYVAATISQAALFGARIVPSLSVYSERRSEFKAYMRETPFGLIGSAQLGLFSRLPQTVSYQLEYGRTVAEPAFFCAVFNVCEAEARQRLERGTRSAVVGWSATRSSVASLSASTSGSVMRVDLRHASPVVGSARDASFNRGTVDATWYRPALSGALVVRLRAGAVLGSRLLTGSPRFIPLQERLYAGGPNSVRGYRQNELGPAIYLPLGVDTIPIPGSDTLVYLQADPTRVGERTVPTGGDNVVVGNIELRVRSFAFPELMQMAFFVDAGQVWNRGRAGTGVDFGQIRVTPGAGLRIFSPVGPIRVDVGYNPYQRPAGPAYVTTSLEASGALICASPGNTLRVRKAEPGIPARQFDEGDCPATYAPRRSTTFLSRLTFQFSIGQPF